MMSTLTNFWKIAKGFLDGKYRKVRHHCVPKVPYTDYSGRDEVELTLDHFKTKSITSTDDGSRHYQALRISPLRILRLFGYGGDEPPRRRKLFAIPTPILQLSPYNKTTY